MTKYIAIFITGLILGFITNETLHNIKKEDFKSQTVLNKLVDEDVSPLTPPNLVQEDKEVIPPVKIIPTKELVGMKNTYYLQLGAFRYPFFSDRLITKVEGLGYKTNVYKISKENYSLTVVEVGPFKKKEQALKHRSIIADKIGTEGKILFKPRIE